MSDTYKTKPDWVKINKPESAKAVSEHHDHRFGPCDIDEITDKTRPFYWQRWDARCGYTVSYYGYHGGFFARPPRGKEIRKTMEGMTRAAWRKAKHDLLKLDSDGIEDYDVKSYQHRHSALWEMY
jgi:hypothetical protein